MEDLPEIQRTAFIGALTGAVASARTDASLLGILLIDITNLSRINHYHGYGTGDRILAAAYQRLLGVSKLGAKEFESWVRDWPGLSALQ